MILIFLGVRVVILNTVFEYAWFIFEQAGKLGMMERGWAWLVTDGITVGPGQGTGNMTGYLPVHLLEV